MIFCTDYPRLPVYHLRQTFPPSVINTKKARIRKTATVSGFSGWTNHSAMRAMEESKLTASVQVSRGARYAPRHMLNLFDSSTQSAQALCYRPILIHYVHSFCGDQDRMFEPTNVRTSVLYDQCTSFLKRELHVDVRIVGMNFSIPEQV